MKHFYLISLLFVSSISFAQVPSNYYDSANGLSGFALKTQLKRIINDSNDGLSTEFLHMDQGDNLDNLYGTSDLDLYYENDGTILDIYSENPTGVDPYNYVFQTDECSGSFSSEGDCYNKEHIIPKSVYNDASPMVDDGHTVIPTDGRVNGLRSNLPFGVVDDSQLISQSGVSNPTMNGSKAGGNLNSGYSAGYTSTVFEPIDEFKGDVARMYFYFVTRYEDQVDNWSAFPMFNGSNNQALDEPFLTILLTWHANDPVSQKEIDRNNTVFNYQNNRNPFVDNPNYANLIWSSSSDTTPPSDPTNLVASNPTNNSIDLNWTASTDDVGVVGYNIYVDGSLYGPSLSTDPSFTVLSLGPDNTYCFRVTALDGAGNESGLSNEDCETTTVGNNLNCIEETFQNIPANSSQYTSFMWTGDNGFDFSATDARTDQTLDGRAITIRDGSLQYTDNLSDIIEEFTVTTQRVFSGGSGTFDLVINGNVVGTIPYDDTVTTTTISNIDLGSETFNTLSIQNNSNGSNRVRFDNMSWTCGLLNTPEYDLDNVRIYPNPAKDILNIDLQNNVDTTIEIYDILGKRILKRQINSEKRLNIQDLKSGIYILKITQGEASTTKRLIKN
ncbi:endonuclease [Winogradskyella tangerina]|uniref:endonuclease n=1 Tax=Winogradskyella tangerina TaxID=2023240 RepID=UPI000DBE0858|nr:endonuclease [Winogradskyella tangerina]